ncbi:MAG: phospholipase [Chloroflexi bacterium]|nr:phospholipase [Chloroflexota bacterium]
MNKKRGSYRTRRAGFSPWVLLAGLVIVLAIAGASALFGATSLLPPPPPSTPASGALQTGAPVTSLPRANVAQGEWYTVYFTLPSYPEKKESRSGGVDRAIAADLERAQKTIDAAVFDFRLPSLVDGFARAAARGVRVRLVTDYAANRAAKDFTDAVDKMEKAGVQVLRDQRSSLMHNKFVVIDQRLLWTGSMNFTANDVYRNNNNMLRLALPALIENYNARFERLFQSRSADAPGKEVPQPRVTLANGVTLENYFSPTGGAAKAILDKLKSAQKSIRITAFTFTDTAMADVLKAQAKAKVNVQGVFETRNNGASGAEFPGLKRAKLEVLEDGNCYILHSKTMVIDDRYVVTGSYNFTANADKSNDENLLIIDDPELAQEYTTEFNRIYAQAKNPTVCGASNTLSDPGSGDEQ